MRSERKEIIEELKKYYHFVFSENTLNNRIYCIRVKFLNIGGNVEEEMKFAQNAAERQLKEVGIELEPFLKLNSIHTQIYRVKEFTLPKNLKGHFWDKRKKIFELIWILVRVVTTIWLAYYIYSEDWSPTYKDKHFSKRQLISILDLKDSLNKENKKRLEKINNDLVFIDSLVTSHNKQKTLYEN